MRLAQLDELRLREANLKRADRRVAPAGGFCNSVADICSS